MTTCNMCGKEFDVWDLQERFGISKHCGFGTKFDGCSIELDLCCDCMERVVDMCKISPVK